MTNGQGQAFAVDEATEQRLRESVLPALAALLDTLPAVPPTGADTQAYAIAHGFYCRIARTCQGSLLLIDAGLNSEAAPLQRAALEHVLALAWVIDEGSAAAAALMRAQQHRMNKIKAAIADRWDIRPEEFDSLLGLDVPTQNQDHLVSFSQLCQQYDVADDLLAAWLTDTGGSHPSISTANPYWHDSSRRLSTYADLKHAGVHETAWLWWLGSCEMDRLVDWGARLTAIGEPAGLSVVRLDRRSDPHQ